MKRRNFIQSGSLAATAVALPSWTNALNLTMYEMIMIRKNVGLFIGRGGTIGFLLQPDNLVVVDAQFPEQADYFIHQIKDQSAAPMPYLINTHHHRDHTAGNISFKGFAEHVLAHDNSKLNQMTFARRDNVEAVQLYPDETYSKRWQKRIGDEFVDIQYWGPAHTNGDSIIHFQNANIVHCGDLVFNRKYPYIDKGAGAMIDNWINILQQMQSNFDDDTRFIFGHCQDGYDVQGNKDDVAAFADYLTAVMEFVGSEIKNGKSQEEIMAATEIPGAPQWTGEGIQRSLSAAYMELSNW